MDAFIASTPLLSPTPIHTLTTCPNRKPNAPPCRTRTPFRMQATGPSSEQPPADLPNQNVASWQEELRLLLDPAMPTGAKQVLIQDLAKRFPDILNDSVFNTSCKDLGLDGLADVLRQFQDDLLPDLVKNGPRYFANAAEGLPDALANMAGGAETMRAGFPAQPADVQREFRNIFNKTPEGLFTPEYVVLAECEGYQIRQYPTFIIAETPMSPRYTPGLGPTEIETASAMGKSFNSLAGFLFGKNEDSKAMKMTTPVILNKYQSEQTMSFIIGEYESVEDVPKSLSDSVTLREQVGKVYAVSEFTGYVTQGEAKRQREKLLSMLSRDNVALSPDAATSYKCMIYNGPSTLPTLRRNEMMIEVIYSQRDEEES